MAAFIRDEHLTVSSALHSNVRALIFVSSYAAAFLLGWAVDHPVAWVLAWSFQAFLLLGCVAAQHEAVHDNLYRIKRWNRVAGALWASAFLFHYGEYRYAHLEHHVNTHGPGDTEPQESFSSLAQYLLLAPVSGVAFMAMRWWGALRTLVGKPPRYVRNAGQRRVVNLNTAYLLAVLAGLAYGLATRPGLVAAVWLMPLLLMGAGLIVMVVLPEHYDCEFGPASPLVTTRTTLSNRLFRFFYWNTNFHTAHHLCPSVPAQHLATLHRFIAPRCDYVEPSYLRWHWGLAQRLLKGGGATAKTPRPRKTGRA